jgi:hypothetical protein
MSYRDSADFALKVAKCLNAECRGLSTVTIVDDPADNVGDRTSIAIGVDGFPIISYQDVATHALQVAKCVTPDCSGSTVISTLDGSPNVVASYSSIAIGSDGLPVVSYEDFSTVEGLKVAKCVNAECSGTSTITIVDGGVDTSVGSYNSIAIGVDGFPVISYHDVSNKSLKVAKCLNHDCSGSATISVVDPTTNLVGEHTSLAIGADGFPVISYRDITANALRVAKCVNAACTGSSIISVVDDPADSVGSFTSIKVPADGLPIVAYLDSTAQRLKVAKCNKPSCSP